jgi:hypothetical protein
MSSVKFKVKKDGTRIIKIPDDIDLPKDEFEVEIETKSKRELVDEFIEKFSGAFAGDDNEEENMKDFRYRRITGKHT